MYISNTDPLIEFTQARKTKSIGEIYEKVNNETQVIQLWDPFESVEIKRNTFPSLFYGEE